MSTSSSLTLVDASVDAVAVAVVEAVAVAVSERADELAPSAAPDPDRSGVVRPGVQQELGSSTSIAIGR